MTVSYNSDVFNASFWSFLRTMLRWHGSIWKMIYAELIIWCLLFTLFTLVYRLALTIDQQIAFEKVCLLLNKYGDLLPVTFMLGFYVSLVVTRWQNFWNHIGWVDNAALTVASCIFGYDERSLMIRRTIMRYLCCMQVMVFRSVSKPVKKRFPTLESLVDAGYVTSDELEHFADNKFWMPAKWSMYLVNIARKEGRVKSDQAVQLLFSFIVDLRTNLTYLFWNDWVSVPILYTQVIFLIVRLYFLLMVLGRQFLNTERHSSSWPVDPYVPIISIIQFTFLIGWSKVAEGLLNPFGDDDDDFEMNYIIDRNLQLSMATVTIPQNSQPKLCRDKFFEDAEPVPFYSLQTVDQIQNPNLGSAALMEDSVRIKRDSVFGRRNTRAELLNAGILIKTRGGLRVRNIVSKDSERRFSSPAEISATPAKLLNGLEAHQNLCSSNLDKHNLCPVNEDDEGAEEGYDEIDLTEPKTKHLREASLSTDSNDFESFYLERPATTEIVYQPINSQDVSTQTTSTLVELDDIKEMIRELRGCLKEQRQQMEMMTSSNSGSRTNRPPSASRISTNVGTDPYQTVETATNTTDQPDNASNDS